MFRWLRSRRNERLASRAVLFEIADYLSDISETLERIEGHAFSAVNAVEADR